MIKKETIIKVIDNYIFYGLMLSAFGSLGFDCMFGLYSLAVFHEAHKHPNFAIFCEFMGLVSLFICIGIFLLNAHYLLNINNKLKTIIKEILIIIITFIPYLYVWGFIISILEKLT